MSDIAIEIGCNYRTLMRHMRDFGIERRDRSESIRLQWVDNHRRREQLSEQVKRWSKENPERAREKSLKANITLQTTSPTSIERRLMSELDRQCIGYHFQYVVGGKFLCDFGFPESMLIVECDGTYWHNTPKQKLRDASKEAYLRACGYEVIRFTDKEIRADVTGCVRHLQTFLHAKATTRS